MEVVQKTPCKVVVRQRKHNLIRVVLCCLLLALLFYMLDARHPKSSLYCTRHAVLPDNEFEARKGLHVEDIDCSLVVRPTTTALDLTFFGEVSYSFEISSAYLVRPPKNFPDPCRKRCLGQTCSCRLERQSLRGQGISRHRTVHRETRVEDGDADEVKDASEAMHGEKDQSEGGGDGEHSHHSMHSGVKDVATLVLEDNQGRTYDFYTFQDEAVAEQMLNKVLSFIEEARKGVPLVSGEASSLLASHDGSASLTTTAGGDKEPVLLELEVLYDDSWLDEMACAAFIILALVLMTRPYKEVVEFDGNSGAMAVDRWNLYQCGVFRYSCALENVSKLEITEVDVYMMSAHAFEHMRQGKEFGLRVLFSSPAWTGTAVPAMPSSADAGATTAGGTVVQPRSLRYTCRTLRRCGGSFFGGVFGWRRPVARTSDRGSGNCHLDLAFGAKVHDDKKLRGPVELVNDLLLRYATDTEAAGGRRSERSTDGNCCVCFRRRSRVVTFPCMHMATCPQCSRIIDTCPLCRTGINERHTVFL